MKIILASQSPRRRELLERMGVAEFEVRPAQGEERVEPGLTPAQMVEQLSVQKAREIAVQEPEALVIAADTVVAVDETVLGKPHSRQEAVEMLTRLSGRSHTVYTGLTVCCGQRELTCHEETQVVFCKLTPEQIQAYVDTLEPMDKAGSYGIQGRGCVLVEGVRGDYYNVVGLPVCRLANMLRAFGVEPLARSGEG